MSNVYAFPSRKVIDTRERLRILGDLLRECYEVGLEPDPELEKWILEAEASLNITKILEA